MTIEQGISDLRTIRSQIEYMEFIISEYERDPSESNLWRLRNAAKQLMESITERQTKGEILWA